MAKTLARPAPSRLYCVGRVPAAGPPVIFTLARNDVARIVAYETKAAAVAACVRVNAGGLLPLSEVPAPRAREPVRVIETSTLDLLSAGWRGFGVDVCRAGPGGSTEVVHSSIVGTDVPRGATVASLERMLRRIFI